ncbi:MAG TPA: hypothetical protein VHY31_08670 [Streptosporangiaceae bacterium]|nr:hypothetical protein [Streptosporangiaceae bacterium]
MVSMALATSRTCRSWPPGILAGWQDRGLVPQDAAPEFAARSLRVWRACRGAVRDWRPSPYAGPIDAFGPPTAMALPAAAAQRAHESGADGHPAGAPRELLAGQR